MADEKPPELGDLMAALAKLRPPSESTSLAALASLLYPPAVKDAWYKGQTIQIDGYTFEDCRFDGCKLITELATFKFRRCYISSDCRVYFKGAALKTARLLMHVLRVQERIEVREDELGVYAALNHDGTFTLE